MKKSGRKYRSKYFTMDNWVTETGGNWNCYKIVCGHDQGKGSFHVLAFHQKYRVLSTLFVRDTEHMFSVLEGKNRKRTLEGE